MGFKVSKNYFIPSTVVKEFVSFSIFKLRLIKYPTQITYEKLALRKDKIKTDCGVYYSFAALYVSGK